MDRRSFLGTSMAGAAMLMLPALTSHNPAAMLHRELVRKGKGVGACVEDNVGYRETYVCDDSHRFVMEEAVRHLAKQLDGFPGKLHFRLGVLYGGGTNYRYGDVIVNVTEFKSVLGPKVIVLRCGIL